MPRQKPRLVAAAATVLRLDAELMEMVLAAVAQNGLALEYASRLLKLDRDVVLAAVEQNGAALQFAADHLQADAEVVVAAAGAGFRHTRCGGAMTLPSRARVAAVPARAAAASASDAAPAINAGP